METIEDAAVKGAPWRRFAPKGLGNQGFKGFAQGHRRGIALCVGRYVMKNPEVVEARQKLYENLKKYSSADDPYQIVIDQIQKAIRKYIKTFNLKKMMSFK